MNKLIIDRNNIKDYSDEYINISNNIVTFLKNNEYKLTYRKCTNTNIKFIINPNVTIKLYTSSTNENLNNNIDYILNEHSNLLLFKFYNNQTVSENIKINLDGKYSKISYFFSNICTKKENYNITINHNNKFVESYLNNKCISNSNSKITYNIDTILPKGNTNCIMDQNTKIIELGNTESKINPNMFIEEESVEAKHGSVIGKFSEDDIFYLTSRGISKHDSIKLLIKGFILSNLEIDEQEQKNIIDLINKNWR